MVETCEPLLHATAPPLDPAARDGDEDVREAPVGGLHHLLHQVLLGHLALGLLGGRHVTYILIQYIPCTCVPFIRHSTDYIIFITVFQPFILPHLYASHLSCILDPPQARPIMKTILIKLEKENNE